MKTTKEGAVRRQLSTLFNIGATRELTDGQLLERFSTGPGEVADLAFEALLQRHGAMVLRVCRAQLADHHDTQDAFQATFLILVKKARASGFEIPWARGCIKWPCARRRASGRMQRGAGGTKDVRPSWRRITSATKTDPRPSWSECSMQRSTGSRSATAFQSCSVTSRLTPARRLRGGWAARLERSRAGVSAGGSACATA